MAKVGSIYPLSMLSYYSSSHMVYSNPPPIRDTASAQPWHQEPLLYLTPLILYLNNVLYTGYRSFRREGEMEGEEGKTV